MRIIFSIAVLLAVISATSAQQWQQNADEYGSKVAEISALAKPPHDTTTTTLTLQCSPGKDGTVSLTYKINGIDGVPDIRFDDFEGPDAPAASETLVTVQAGFPERVVKIHTAVGGWYTDATSFAFSFSRPVGAKSEITYLTDAIMQGATTISVEVTDFNDRSKTIWTEFPAQDAGTVVAETMKPCLGNSSSNEIDAKSTKLEEAAREFTAKLSEGNFAEAVQQFGDPIATTLTPEELEDVWKTILAHNGAFQTILKVQREKTVDYGGKKFDVFLVLCQFERGKSGIRLNFNSEQQITSVWFVPAAE